MKTLLGALGVGLSFATESSTPAVILAAALAAVLLTALWRGLVVDGNWSDRDGEKRSFKLRVRKDDKNDPADGDDTGVTGTTKRTRSRCTKST